MNTLIPITEEDENVVTLTSIGLPQVTLTYEKGMGFYLLSDFFYVEWDEKIEDLDGITKIENGDVILLGDDDTELKLTLSQFVNLKKLVLSFISE